MNYAPYAETEDSGVAWIGYKPMHWQVMKLHHMVRMKSGSAITSVEMEDDGQYPVFGGNGVRGRFSQYTHDGSYVLIGRQGAECGNINYAHGKFWASEHAVVATPDRKLEYRWLGETLRAMNLNQYSQAAAQPGLSVEVIGRLKLPFPPLAEQRQIAAFLDWKTGQIDSLIARKKELLEKLKEKRLAVVTQAVTRGINPGVPLRDTAFPWIGHVPAHWEVKRLKFQAGTGKGAGIQIGPFGGMLTELTYAETGEFKLYGQENVLSGDFDKGTRWLTTEQYADLRQYAAEAGDVLFTRKGSIGGCAVFPENGRPGIIDSDTIRLRVNPKTLSTRFLLYAVRESEYLQFQVQLIKRGAILSGLNTTTIADLMLVAPPLDEQIAISNYLDRQASRINQLATHVETAIVHLTEYRTALITAATTGKIDVRKVEVPVFG